MSDIEEASVTRCRALEDQWDEPKAPISIVYCVLEPSCDSVCWRLLKLFATRELAEFFAEEIYLNNQFCRTRISTPRDCVREVVIEGAL